MLTDFYDAVLILEHLHSAEYANFVIHLCCLTLFLCGAISLKGFETIMKEQTFQRSAQMPDQLKKVDAKNVAARKRKFNERENYCSFSLREKLAKECLS